MTQSNLHSMNNATFSRVNCNQFSASLAEYFGQSENRKRTKFLNEYFDFLIPSLASLIKVMAEAEIEPSKVLPNPLQLIDKVEFWRPFIGRLDDVYWSIAFSKESIECKIETPLFPNNHEYLQASLSKANSNIQEIFLLFKEHSIDKSDLINLNINGQIRSLEGLSSTNAITIKGSVSNQISVSEQIKLGTPENVGESVFDLLKQALNRLGQFYSLIAVDLSTLVEGTESYESRTYPEGALKYKMHRERERDPRVIKEAKEQFARQNDGRIFCEVCGFDFNQVYGARGKGYAEGHHNLPLAKMGEGHNTSPEDISIVCANCHRMLHRKPFSTVEQLKSLVNSG